MGKPYGQKTLGVELGVFNTYGALDGDGLLAGLDGFLDTADVCDGDGWSLIQFLIAFTVTLVL